MINSLDITASQVNERAAFRERTCKQFRADLRAMFLAMPDDVLEYLLRNDVLANSLHAALHQQTSAARCERGENCACIGPEHVARAWRDKCTSWRPQG